MILLMMVMTDPNYTKQNLNLNLQNLRKILRKSQFLEVLHPKELLKPMTMMEGLNVSNVVKFARIILTSRIMFCLITIKFSMMCCLTANHSSVHCVINQTEIE